jgi:serine/threonine protein kinase
MSNSLVYATLTPRYTIIRNLDSSLYGSVELALDNETKCTVCVKVSDKNRSNNGHSKRGPIIVLENVRQEAKILKFLTEQRNGNNSIVQYVDELEDNNYHYLITEYCERDLFFTLKALEKNSFPYFTEAEARVYFRQLIQAVSFLHKNHIAHVDLSIENICLANGNKVKLIDFGLAIVHPNSPNYKSIFLESTDNNNKNNESKLLKVQVESGDPNVQFQCKAFKTSIRKQADPDQVYSKPGKEAYISPELFYNEEWNAYQNDCYALGVILFLMVAGRPPYTQINDSWFQLIYFGKWKQRYQTIIARETFGHLSASVIDLIDNIIKPCKVRYTLTQMLEHKWMQDETKQEI